MNCITRIAPSYISSWKITIRAQVPFGGAGKTLPGFVEREWLL
jgi:hypothetical protein